MKIDPRLHRLLGGEPLAALRKRLRERFERAPLAGGLERIRIHRLSPEEHTALAGLLGRSPRFSSSLQVEIHRLDAALQQAGIAASLRDALEQLDGPIVHLASARSQRHTLWSEVIDGCTHPGLLGWLQTPAHAGLLKRLAGQDATAALQLCQRAEAVLRRTPAHGITRAQLAAEVLGDAHALDNGRRTATLVLAVWRQLEAPASDDEEKEEEGEEEGTATLSGPVLTQERVRDVWAKAGVLVNELARPALFLNLPAAAAAAQSLGWHAGEPAYASLRALLRAPPAWQVAGRKVYVCENPNLVAIAADHWGRRCAPLVCTDGMPAAAQRCLLSQLAQAGAQLCYHGDFDWPGLRIGNCVIREHGAQAWRFGAADYAAAVQAAPRPGKPLAGVAVDALWDAALTAGMQTHRLAIAEEGIAASLLQDLEDR